MILTEEQIRRLKERSHRLRPAEMVPKEVTDLLDTIEAQRQEIDVLTGELSEARKVEEHKVERINALLRLIEKSIGWKVFGHAAETLLQDLGKEYYIKEDLRKEMAR